MDNVVSFPDTAHSLGIRGNLNESLRLCSVIAEYVGAARAQLLRLLDETGGTAEYQLALTIVRDDISCISANLVDFCDGISTALEKIQ